MEHSMRIVALTLAAGLLASVGAYAQSPSQAGAGEADAQQPPSTRDEVWNGPMGQQVKQQLEQAGFKDVTMVPTSVLIKTKNPKGNQVVILIDFNTMTALQLGSGDDETTG